METLIKFNFTTRLLCLLIWVVVSSGTKVDAQEVLNIDTESAMRIEGTSTLHGWTSTVERIHGEGRFLVHKNTIQHIDGLKVTIEVKSIKSGKGVLMDKNTYKALQSEQYPTIQYVLQTVKILPGNKLTTTGKLTIAGVSKMVVMPVSYRLQSTSRLSITGELPIVLRDYNIDPPVAMMGTIRTGEEVKVIFNAVFTSEKQLSSLVK